MAMERKQKAATESGALLLIVGGILMAANALSGLAGGYKRIDMTREQRYGLTKGTARLLQSLKPDQAMKVDAYVVRGLPSLNKFTRDLRDLLQEYKESSKGNFDYTLIEAKTDEEKNKAKEAGLQEIALQEASEEDDGDKVGLKKGYIGLVLNYGSERKAIPMDPRSLTGLEFWLTNEVREIRDKADGIKHKIGVITGHDEIKLTENLTPKDPQQPQSVSVSSVITSRFPFYKIEDVDLKGGDAAISDEYDGLIITQPGKEFTEKELRRVDEFVLKGKSLAVFAGAANIKSGDAHMASTLNTYGLEKLLSGYGIELAKNVIVDFGLPARLRLPTAAGLVVAGPPFPLIPMLEDDPAYSGDKQFLDSTFPPFSRLGPVPFPFPSSLVAHKEKQDGAEFVMVARTSPRSIARTTENISLDPFQNWNAYLAAARSENQAYRQYGIAMTVEGNLKTAFPEGDKMGIDVPAKGTSKSRILVVASPQYFLNPFARAGSGPDLQGIQGAQGLDLGDKQLKEISMYYINSVGQAVVLSFKNTLDWLSGDSDLIAANAKLLSDPPLRYDSLSARNFDAQTEEQIKKQLEEIKVSRKSKQRNVEIILILGLPLAFVAFGLIRWRMRMNAREVMSLA